MIDNQHSKITSLDCIYSASFPQLLETLNISLFLSAYQAGKLIVARANQGQLTTIARHGDRVMGIAVTPDQLAVGTRREVCTWKNVPQLTRHCDAIAHCDACFVPHSPIMTGDLGVRELAWGDNHTLWIASTRFSGLFALNCLSQSINPKSIWQPPFISAFKAEDRCHLNGIAMLEGKPKYVTVLGETNASQGWRNHKVTGGCAIDIPSKEMVARGFTMPHSPRIYDRRLWLLDSGWGRLVVVDSNTGKHAVVAEFPGFTRGLAFCDRYAFVGLSQIRDRTTFHGLPIETRSQRLECGVRAIAIDTGKTVGFLKFLSGCTELFDVQILQNCRQPTLLGNQM